MGLILRTSIETWELEKRFLDRTIVIDVDRILEHVVDEVRVWLNEVIQGREDFKILSLLLVEKIEAHLILVELHLVDSLLKFVALVVNHLLPLLDLLFLFLKLFNLLVNLLLHHLEQILVLDLQLVHNSTEALLKLIDLFVELLSNLHLKFVVQFLVHGDRLVMFLNLYDHLFNHLFHFIHLR